MREIRSLGELGVRYVRHLDVRVNSHRGIRSVTPVRGYVVKNKLEVT